MSYKSPGVTVINAFEPLLNPTTGGDRLLGIVAGFDSTNLNFYPQRVLNFRRADIRYSPFDVITYVKPKNIIPSGGISDENRVVSVVQGLSNYKRLPTTGDAVSGTFAYTRNGYGLYKLVQFTRNTSSLIDECTPFSMGGSQPFQGEGYDYSTGTDLVYGENEGSGRKRWLIYYDQVSNTFTLFHEGVDFNVVVSDAGSGQIKIKVTWLSDPGIPNGANFYGLYRDMNSTNVPYDDSDDLWYSILRENGTNDTSNQGTNFDYILIPFKGSGVYSTNIGWVVYFIKDGSNFNTITPDSPAAPTSSSTYTMTIRYEVPKGANIYTTFGEVSSSFGPLVDPNNANAINEPTLAAWLAFGEGAPYIMLSVWDTAVPSTIDDAFEALAANDQPNIIVAVSDSLASTVGSVNNKLYNHVLNTSSDIAKKYRIGIYHPYNVDLVSPTFATVLNAFDTETQAINSSRMILVAPPQVSFNIPVSPLGMNRTYTFNGKYLGVVYGAMMARPEYDVATSMLRKPSKTIVDINPIWDDIKMDKIASKAVTLFSKINAQWTIRDDLTTSRLNQIMQSEPTITMISDDIAKSAIKIFDVAVIGAKLKIPTMLEAIKARLLNMLDAKAKDGIIAAYGTPSVSVDPLDPRKVICTIPVQPMFSLKYLDITFSYVAKI